MGNKVGKKAYHKNVENTRVRNFNFYLLGSGRGFWAGKNIISQISRKVVFWQLLMRCIRAGVSNSFSRVRGAHKGLNVILGLYKCNYSLTMARSLALPPGRNKVGTRCWLVKQGGGLDSALRPCVCHLCIRGTETFKQTLILLKTNSHFLWCYCCKTVVWDKLI